MTIKIFFSYAQEDEALLNKLKIYLRPLQQEHLIDMWNDRDISVGTDWEREIDKHLNMAQIILLLISQYSLNSDYFYSIETQRAIELHERGEARVIPIILRPVYYQKTPFAMFKVLPEDAKPVTTWRDQDKAFKNVAEGIRKVVNELSQHYGTSEETKDKLLIEGNNFYNAKRYEEALAAFDRALALDPKNTDGWYAKGTVLRALKRYEEALAAFDHALALDPKNTDAKYNKDITFKELERNKEASGASTYSSPQILERQESLEPKKIAPATWDPSSNEVFTEKVLNATQMVVVNFSSDKSASCQIFDPEFAAVSKEYEGRVTFAKLDVDANEALTSEWNVDGIPTLIFFKNGQEINRVRGVVMRDRLRRMIAVALQRIH